MKVPPAFASYLVPLLSGSRARHDRHSYVVPWATACKSHVPLAFASSGKRTCSHSQGCSAEHFGHRIFQSRSSVLSCSWWKSSPASPPCDINIRFPIQPKAVTRALASAICPRGYSQASSPITVRSESR